MVACLFRVNKLYSLVILGKHCIKSKYFFIRSLTNSCNIKEHSNFPHLGEQNNILEIFSEPRFVMHILLFLPFNQFAVLFLIEDGAVYFNDIVKEIIGTESFEEFHGKTRKYDSICIDTNKLVNFFALFMFSSLNFSLF